MDIKPEECYHIDSVFVNDVYVGTPIQYQFNNVRGDSTLRAVFARDSFMVVAIQNEGGTITPVDTSWVKIARRIFYSPRSPQPKLPAHGECCCSLVV